jgi:hypothetical protein
LQSFFCVLLNVDALKELWITDLLPEERKLKSLKQVHVNYIIIWGEGRRSSVEGQGL